MSMAAAKTGLLNLVKWSTTVVTAHVHVAVPVLDLYANCNESVVSLLLSISRIIKSKTFRIKQPPAIAL